MGVDRRQRFHGWKEPHQLPHSTRESKPFLSLSFHEYIFEMFPREFYVDQ